MGNPLGYEEMSTVIKTKTCSNCGKKFEWEVYDEVAHDEVADVRIIGQCPNMDCDESDDMLEFIATGWRKVS